jgi:hypothetical protein
MRHVREMQKKGNGVDKQDRSDFLFNPGVVQQMRRNYASIASLSQYKTEKEDK